MAEKHDAKVEILTVVDEVKMAPDWAREYSEKLREQGEEVLASTFSKAVKQKPNIKISKRLAEGYASEEILKCAEVGHHDLIIMGSRGMARASRTRLLGIGGPLEVELGFALS